MFAGITCADFRYDYDFVSTCGDRDKMDILKHQPFSTQTRTYIYPKIGFNNKQQTNNLGLV